MTEEQQRILLIAMFAIAIVAAYAIGARGRRREKAAAATKDATSASETKPAATPANDAKAAKAPAAAKPAPATAVATATATPTAKAPAKAGGASLAKLEYEEDEEIDPTRVGGGPAPKPPTYQPPVKKIVYDEDAATDEPTRTESLFLVSATAQTDTGLRRKRNEDSLLALETESLFVVADGMGGYGGGDQASQLAVKTIAEAYRTGTFDGEPHDGVPRQASELARAMQMANAAILETAKGNPALDGMGTTLCAARFAPNKKRLYIGHVGDSRCYRMRAGTLKQMTADHTMADHGVQGPSAAHLSRAVGIWPTVPIDIVMGVPQDGDVYLLCSDGLTKMVPDRVIADVLADAVDLKAAVEKLISEANARGGKDNVTVVLVRVAARA